MIKSLRVDHRLLHGQVAFNWTSHLNANCILLANDSLLGDELRLTSIKLAKPTGVKLVVKNIADSIEAIKSGVTDKYNLFIVVESIADAAKLVQALDLHDLNLGGTKSAPDKRKLSKAIYVTEEEEDILKKMISDGVNIRIQMIPTEKVIPVQSVL